MVLGDVEETITVVDVDEDTLKEVIRVRTSQPRQALHVPPQEAQGTQLDHIDSTTETAIGAAEARDYRPGNEYIQSGWY